MRRRGKAFSDATTEPEANWLDDGSADPIGNLSIEWANPAHRNVPASVGGTPSNNHRAVGTFVPNDAHLGTKALVGDARAEAAPAADARAGNLAASEAASAEHANPTIAVDYNLSNIIDGGWSIGFGRSQDTDRGTPSGSAIDVLSNPTNSIERERVGLNDAGGSPSDSATLCLENRCPQNMYMLPGPLREKWEGLPGEMVPAGSGPPPDEKNDKNRKTQDDWWDNLDAQQERLDWQKRHVPTQAAKEWVKRNIKGKIGDLIRGGSGWRGQIAHRQKIRRGAGRH